MNTYIIYKYTNKENKKIYIGLTKNTPKERAHTDFGNGYQSCTHFYRAILKAGGLSKGFDLEILKENLSQKEANYWEDYYIKLYDTKNPDKGYNINDGGGAISIEQSQKISEWNRQNWTDGKYDSMKTPVYCVETEKTYESLSDAERQTGICRTGIKKACSGTIRYSGSLNGKALHWLYLKNVTKERIDELKNREETCILRPLYCIELNKIYESASEAKRELGIDTRQILNNAKGKPGCLSAGKHPETKEKLHWCYADTIEFKEKYKSAGLG